MFFFLIIEVFGCLHQQVEDFFHGCAVMMWRTKGIRSHPLLILGGVASNTCNFYFEVYYYCKWGIF
jgi:hypothetical protein